MSGGPSIAVHNCKRFRWDLNESPLAIDFSLPSEIVDLRNRVREFCEKEVEPAATRLEKVADRRQWGPEIIRLRKLAHEKGLWLPHMPKGYGGMGLRALGTPPLSAPCDRVPP